MNTNRRWLRLTLAAWLLAVCVPVMAAHQKLSREQKIALLQSLQFQHGTIRLPEARANLHLTPNFSFLDHDDARKLLEQVWDNPPNEKVLGMIVPAQRYQDIFKDGAYAVVVTYSDDGYVSDKNEADIDYDKMLQDMQKRAREVNPERIRQGYDSISLIGWAEPPHYDTSSHELYWAQDLRFGSSAEDSLNYHIRALGRRGYLSLNALAEMSDLATVKDGMRQILPMVQYDHGSRYIDFNSKTDRVAAYGISALIAGTLAAKAGLFAKLFALLLAAKKAVIAGLAAIAAFFRRIFKRKQA